MLEAEPSYLCDNPTAMTRRQLLATAIIATILPKPIAAIIPKPVGPPIPITCIGMPPYVSDLADISSDAKRAEC